jgi:hypothetical protein
MTEKLRDRDTADLVVLGLAAMIGLVMLLSLFGIVALKIAQPDEDIGTPIKVYGDILTVALGAVVGWLGGSATARAKSISNSSEGGPE